jgi:uncharacterized protein YfdQ (DUF2303 family)
MSEAAKVEELVLASAHKPHTVTVSHDGITAQVLVVPDEGGGYTIDTAHELVAPLRTAPVRRKGTARLTDLNSLIAHTNRFKDTDSLVFLDRGQGTTGVRGAKLVAVLDYHRKGADAAPRFGEHRGEYAFPMSDEWVAWAGQDGKPMDQERFARWVEDRLADVAAPEQAGDTAKAFAAMLACGFASPAKLLELSHGLEAHVGQRVKQHVRLATGEVSVHYIEEHQDADGKPLKVPGAFLLGIPVFRGGDPYQLPVRLRYRVNQGAISWSYELHQPQRILDHALAEACAEVAERTGLDVLDGVPE